VVKIRIGVGLGAAGASDDFGAIVCDMEQCGFDSLWLSEVLTTPVIDPLAGLAFAASTVRKLKLGTTLALPGRNPVRLAKELATIDRLSGGRLLLVMVPGLSEPLEQQAIGVPVKERGAWIDEVLPLLRRLWSEDAVVHDGPRYTYNGLTIWPRPAQAPLEMWLGGTAPSALRRAGALSDGWLPSLLTPEEARTGRLTIERFASEAGRQVDPEHFGVSLGYARERISERQMTQIARRRPGVDPSTLVPIGLDSLRQRLQAFIDVGFSKFVVRPSDAPASWRTELAELAEAVLPLQT
jgi:probable F420-dependent oxidoreductase